MKKTCECGNTAAMTRNGEKICMRCFNAEQNRNKIERRQKGVMRYGFVADTYNVCLPSWK